MRIINLGNYRAAINSPSPILPEKEEKGSGADTNTDPSMEKKDIDNSIEKENHFSTSVEVKHH